VHIVYNKSDECVNESKAKTLFRGGVVVQEKKKEEKKKRKEEEIMCLTYGE